MLLRGTWQQERRLEKKKSSPFKASGSENSAENGEAVKTPFYLAQGNLSSGTSCHEENAAVKKWNNFKRWIRFQLKMMYVIVS